jgi:predicted nucleic acid-binding protein
LVIAYLDTSAAMKLIVEEAESEALVAELTSTEERQLVASWLLHTELHCAAGRHPDSIPVENVAGVLDAVTLVDLTRGDMIAAGTHAPLRSNDALHLAVAIRLGVDEIITYDREMAEAASAVGFAVVAPGRTLSSPSSGSPHTCANPHGRTTS